MVDRRDDLEPKERIEYTRLRCRVLERISKIPRGALDLEK